MLCGHLCGVCDDNRAYHDYWSCEPACTEGNHAQSMPQIRSAHYDGLWRVPRSLLKQELQRCHNAQDFIWQEVGLRSARRGAFPC